MRDKNNKPTAISPLTLTKRETLEILRSNQNPTIRRLVGLRNHRRRRAAGVILVDGARETRRALESGLQLQGFYEPVANNVQRGPAPAEENENVDLQQVRLQAVQHGVYRGIASELFAKVCYGEASGRCLAEFAAPGDSVSDLPDLPPGLILVLDRVEKPGNLGAIFRSADAAGVSAVLLSDCPSDRFNSNAIRGSLGAVFTVPSARGSQAEIAAFLSAQVDNIFAMRVEGSVPLYHTNLRADGERGRIAVVLGSEADGLKQRWRSWHPFAPADHELTPELPIAGIRLPMAGQVDSLNVSVSAALVAYESVRQQGL